MSDRFGFLLFAIVLLPMGVYAALNPRRAKKENADGPYFKTGLAKMPMWFFRAAGISTIAMGGFFAYLFWTR